MTLKQIKIMFSPGDAWQVQRICETVPGTDCNEHRTIVAVRTRCLVSKRPDGKDIETEWPKAPEILEARDGFLKLRYEGWGTVVTLAKIT